MSFRTNKQLEFFINLAKVQTKITRTFDSALNGISYTELIILYHLNLAKDNKLRRIDLAEKVGLTASGITRLLMPMEKIGLVGREANARDARVKYVTLVQGGKEKLEAEIEYANQLAITKYPDNKASLLGEINDLLTSLPL